MVAFVNLLLTKIVVVVITTNTVSLYLWSGLISFNSLRDDCVM